MSIDENKIEYIYSQNGFIISFSERDISYRIVAINGNRKISIRRLNKNGNDLPIRAEDLEIIRNRLSNAKNDYINIHKLTPRIKREDDKSDYNSSVQFVLDNIKDVKITSPNIEYISASKDLNSGKYKSLGIIRFSFNGKKYIIFILDKYNDSNSENKKDFRINRVSNNLNRNNTLKPINMNDLEVIEEILSYDNSLVDIMCITNDAEKANLASYKEYAQSIVEEIGRIKKSKIISPISDTIEEKYSLFFIIKKRKLIKVNDDKIPLKSKEGITSGEVNQFN